jgi:hypothetical protein
VWPLLAAVGVFVVGASVSVWHGVTDILHGTSARGGHLVAYLVPAISFVMESTSFLQAVRQLGGDARRYDRDLLEYALDTSDPTVRAADSQSAHR